MSDKLLSRERYGEAFWRTHARRHVRNTSAQPLIEMMKPWLEMELGRVPPAGPLAEAIRNALARWPALTRFLDDGRIELDNNTVERAIPTCSPDPMEAQPAGQSSLHCYRLQSLMMSSRSPTSRTSWNACPTDTR